MSQTILPGRSVDCSLQASGSTEETLKENSGIKERISSASQLSVVNAWSRTDDVQQNSSLFTLPDELIFNILGLLTRSEWSVCSLVCKDLAILCNDGALWRKIFEKTFPKIIEIGPNPAKNQVFWKDSFQKVLSSEAFIYACEYFMTKQVILKVPGKIKMFKDYILQEKKEQRCDGESKSLEISRVKKDGTFELVHSVENFSGENLSFCISDEYAVIGDNSGTLKIYKQGQKGLEDPVSLQFKKLDGLDNPITYLEIDEETVFVGFEDGQIQIIKRIDGKEWIVSQILTTQPNNPSVDIPQEESHAESEEEVTWGKIDEIRLIGDRLVAFSGELYFAWKWLSKEDCYTAIDIELKDNVETDLKGRHVNLRNSTYYGDDFSLSLQSYDNKKNQSLVEISTSLNSLEKLSEIARNFSLPQLSAKVISDNNPFKEICELLRTDENITEGQGKIPAPSVINEITRLFNFLIVKDQSKIKYAIWVGNNKDDEGYGLNFGNMVINNLNNAKYFSLFKKALYVLDAPYNTLFKYTKAFLQLPLQEKREVYKELYSILKQSQKTDQKSSESISEEEMIKYSREAFHGKKGLSCTAKQLADAINAYLDEVKSEKDLQDEIIY